MASVDPELELLRRYLHNEMPRAADTPEHYCSVARRRIEQGINASEPLATIVREAMRAAATAAVIAETRSPADASSTSDVDRVLTKLDRRARAPFSSYGPFAEGMIWLMDDALRRLRSIAGTSSADAVSDAALDASAALLRALRNETRRPAAPPGTIST